MIIQAVQIFFGSIGAAQCAVGTDQLTRFRAATANFEIALCEPVVITPSGNDVDYSTKDPRHGITKSTFKSRSLKIRPLQWPALRRLLTGRRCINQNKLTKKGSKQISDHDIC